MEHGYLVWVTESQAKRWIMDGGQQDRVRGEGEVLSRSVSAHRRAEKEIERVECMPLLFQLETRVWRGTIGPRPLQVECYGCRQQYQLKGPSEG